MHNHDDINKLLRQHSLHFIQGAQEEHQTRSNNEQFKGTNRKQIWNWNTEQYGLSDARSIIQKLMQTKQVQIRNIFQKSRIALLSVTQQKIFNELINLMDEIDKLKQQIIQQQQNTQQIQKEHHIKPAINFKEKQFVKTKCHQYHKLVSAKYPQLNYQQLSSVIQENQKMQNQIQILEKECRNEHSRKMLQNQTKKYENLQNQLNGVNKLLNQYPNPAELEYLQSKAKQLTQQCQILSNKNMQRGPSNQRQIPLKIQIQQLKQKNDQLRKLTVKGLQIVERGDITYRQNNQKVAELQQYLQHELKQKHIVLQQMDKYKAKLKQIKRENQEMKQYSNTKPKYQHNSSQNNNKMKHTKGLKKFQGLVSEMETIMSK